MNAKKKKKKYSLAFYNLLFSNTFRRISFMKYLYLTDKFKPHSLPSCLLLKRLTDDLSYTNARA